MGCRPAPLAASRTALFWFLSQAALLSLFASWETVHPSVAVLGQDSDTLLPGDLQALLAIKDSLSDPRGALQSWNGTGIGACQDLWAGVKCMRGEVTILQLAGLGLGGNLSDQVGQLRNLRKLNVHSNAIQGPIPATFGRLAFLRAVYLHDNKFTGEIPQALGSSPLLQRVDLSSNRLTGQVPQGLAMSTRLLFINVSDNMLSGPVPEDWAQNPSVEVLGAARNQLSGPLPGRWAASHLKVLDLSGNSLNGSIPGELGNLMNLTYLDLSRNFFSGAIPDSLKLLPNLSTFNVSSNKLDGSVPALAQTFPSSSFADNPGLCGKELALRSCSDKSKKLSVLAWVGIALGIAIFTVAAACICLLIIWRVRGRKRGAKLISGKRPEESPGSEGDVGGKLVHFDGPLAFTVDDLLRATAEVLGKSSYGTVYKATLEDGNSVAVKRLREGIVKGQKEFEAEVESLGALRHENLLSLRAYYWGPKGEKLLVYDFMPLGSLAAFLHGSRGPHSPLGWQTRLKIATGTARGLAYLHLKEKIVHGNLTSSNILLDRHMLPQISDYGLSRVMTTTANSNVIATAGALGYRAPELTKLKKATFKSDVYSFGVILLELLTGKAPSDTMTGNSLQSIETTLPEWVASVVKEEWTNEVFDVDLMKDSPADDELLSALQLAMSCVVASPAGRPEMDEVVLHLEEITPPPPASQQPLRHDI